MDILNTFLRLWIVSTPISRRTISEKQIPALVSKVKETVLKKLETQPFVSLTTDLWFDRRPNQMILMHLNPTCWTADGLQADIVGNEFLLPLKRSQMNMVSVRR